VCRGSKSATHFSEIIFEHLIFTTHIFYRDTLHSFLYIWLPDTLHSVHSLFELHYRLYIYYLNIALQALYLLLVYFIVTPYIRLLHIWHPDTLHSVYSLIELHYRLYIYYLYVALQALYLLLVYFIVTPYIRLLYIWHPDTLHSLFELHYRLYIPPASPLPPYPGLVSFGALSPKKKDPIDIMQNIQLWGGYG